MTTSWWRGRHTLRGRWTSFKWWFDDHIGMILIVVGLIAVGITLAAAYRIGKCKEACFDRGGLESQYVSSDECRCLLEVGKRPVAIP